MEHSNDAHLNGSVFTIALFHFVASWTCRASRKLDHLYRTCHDVLIAVMVIDGA